MITTKTTKLLASLVLLVIVSACAPRSYVVLLESPDGSVGAVTVSGEQGTQTLNQAGFGTGIDGSTAEPFAVDQAQINNDFGSALTSQPLLPETFRLYFFSDRTTLKEESVALLPTIIEAVNKRPAADISIIGHSDRFGNEGYNHRLALRRAQAVEQRIRAGGLDIAEITVTSHGENNPVVPTADNVREPRNRRVDVTVR